MSGILLPMVHTTNTIKGVAEPVGVDHIVTITAEDAVFVGAGGSNEYMLVFVVNAAGGQTSDRVIWRYATDVLRDADLATLLPIVSASL